VHPACLPEEELLRQCAVERTRASGPGGQHRNRTETAIRLQHRPTGVHGAASERRSQHENLRVALRRLRLNLALEVRGPAADRAGVPPGAWSPSPAWRARVRGGRLAVNPTHRDLPCLLAEALDVLHAYGDDLAAAATALGVTRTQLVRFLGKEPRALAALNARRRERGLPPLR